MCVCVCALARASVCLCECVRACVSTRARMSVRVCASVLMCVFMCVSKYMCVCVRARTCTLILHTFHVCLQTDNYKRISAPTHLQLSTNGQSLLSTNGTFVLDCPSLCNACWKQPPEDLFCTRTSSKTTAPVAATGLTHRALLAILINS